MNDPYWELVCEQWSNIVMWYQLFLTDGKPITSDDAFLYTVATFSARWKTP